jgi:hypothetical protein
VIKDRALWETWERETLLRQPADFRRNLRLLEAMYEETQAFDLEYVHRWLREFDRSLGEKSLERFDEVRQSPPKA